ncbi:hypothetical protein EVAR_31755_1 [Eumeta japonica]|uniref:Uncharacterized protein n=1 Tax=Eumeta variegata TaxID=151549 RepID=A0A4C1W4N5_EUMVA|nr:hypothetical protein EVAR_31755_1 [Eumeta japonica]
MKTQGFARIEKNAYVNVNEKTTHSHDGDAPAPEVALKTLRALRVRGRTGRGVMKHGSSVHVYCASALTAPPMLHYIHARCHALSLDALSTSRGLVYQIPTIIVS